MKTVDYSANRIGTVKSAQQLAHLWKSGDSEWVAERKAQARILTENGYSDNSVKGNKTYMRFFVSGEYTEFIDEFSRYLLTPYDSAETARAVFESGLISRRGREDLFNRYVFLAPVFGQGMPWIRQHVRFFFEGVLGEEHEVIEESVKGRSQVISPEPSAWCQSFISKGIKLFRYPDEYQGCLDCVPYFVSALPRVTIVRHRKRCKLQQLMEQASEVLEQKEAGSHALDFARQLKNREQAIFDNWAVNSQLDESSED